MGVWGWWACVGVCVGVCVWGGVWGRVGCVCVCVCVCVFLSFSTQIQRYSHFCVLFAIEPQC